MSLKTPLYDCHLQAGAKMVPFAGWQMPIHYGSQMEEHHVVRQSAGLFDVSHMTVVDISGATARDFLRYLLANDVAKLDKRDGKALYSGMLNEQGGVIDDLIVYRLEGDYRLVVNSATREKDLQWIRGWAEDFGVCVKERPELAMLAVQGPKVLDCLNTVSADLATQLESLPVFCSMQIEDMMWCRTGYTGEDGFEVILPGEQAVQLWVKLLDAGVRPCGLGARDTLRLEAGMNLYGSDMDESVNPFSCGMGWTVDLSGDRDFVGRAAVLEKSTHPGEIQVGLVLRERGVLRGHQKVLSEAGEGEITSGSFSPTLGFSIALARVPDTIGTQASVEIRGKQLPVTVVKPPFVRKGKSLVI